MRRTTTHLLALLSLFAFASCDKTKDVIPEPEPVDKTVVFEVFGNQDFSYSQYGEEEIRIQLVISRMNNYVADAIQTVVFDSTFTMALKDVPVRSNKMVIRKTVPAVLDKKEQVSVGSGYNYRQQSFGKNQSFPADQVEKTFQLTVY
ncbi:hypothetical protein H9Q13_14155 [Pontibacter sp. JH31]|uniref:Uncharacterized protein n=1 Tax=Pontibacter aquaedesilientis TaxID=2766980 RepID=A0ABR7XJ48_9BACT|nr:hypothetical protein [Pontibacter aquaedesilientis]MBD1398310.1 hypothetical protein [Pontibacter aquaedesilientis]